jgi:hypothetical protein
MKRILTALCLFVCVPVLAADENVPVRSVVLYSSGVGYFEHAGQVNGDSKTELRFKTAQINDVLKSLVLEDLDGGKVSTVTYPSQDPLAKTLKSFQVDISANPSLADLLNQLRGAKVTVSNQGAQVTGTILGVETRKQKVGEKNEIVETHVLNLLTDDKLHAIALESTSGIDLADPQLQKELSAALASLAAARDQDKKPVTISFTGQGQRRVRIGYVVEEPVWKASYRLLLSSDDKDKPKMQGWAIVENQTDNDWNNVQLSLVSGRPISFVQDLYQPLYIPRPVVQPEIYASLRPQEYGAGMDSARKMDTFAAAPLAVAAPALRRARQMASERPNQTGADSNLTSALAEAADKPLDASASVVSVAAAAKLGELFQYTVPNVSLARQRSAMIPIVNDDIEVERLSIYNQSVLAKNPLTGARVKNITGKHLLAGPVTVLDGSAYAGDARIDNVPPGQERLLSYGIDLQMQVNPSTNTQQNDLVTAKVIKGVLQVTWKYVSSQDYLADNKADHDKTLIIEHPVRQGWKLVDTDKPVEQTETVYRFKGKVGADKSSKLVVKEEMVQDQSIAILPMEFGQLDFYRKSGSIPKDVRDALIKAGELKQAMAETQRTIEERTKRLNDITAEQARLRENMKTVDRNSQYYNRLLKKLNDQETDIETRQTELEDLRKKLDKQRGDLEDYLNNLNVG